jgi:hypothetical protein
MTNAGEGDDPADVGEGNEPSTLPIGGATAEPTTPPIGCTTAEMAWAAHRDDRQAP